MRAERNDFLRAQRAAIVSSMILAIGLGFLVYHQLLAAPPKPVRVKKTRIIQAPVDFSAAPTRAIASVGKADPSIQDLRLGCKNLGSGTIAMTVSAVAEKIRLLGSKCDIQEASYFPESITNEANGFTATLLIPKPDEFISDFITLERNANVLEVNLKSQSGENKKVKIDISRN